MALRFSGGPYVNSTYTCTTGVRSEIVTGIVTALNSAGWTTINSGSGAYTLQSGTTPDGLKMNVCVYDPGSGNCARIQIQTTDGFWTSQDSWLAPAAGRVFNIIASPYQFFTWTSTPPSQTSNNYGTYFACGSVALPNWLVGIVTDSFWMQGNSIGDGGGWVGTWRTDLTGYIGDYNTHWSAFVTLNGARTYTERNVANDYYYSGDMTLVGYGSGWHGPTTSGGSGYQGYRWSDNTLLLNDPLVAWGTASPDDEARIQGQLWDAAIASDAFAADTAITIGTHSGVTMTDNNTGNGSNMKGTLIVCYS